MGLFKKKNTQQTNREYLINKLSGRGILYCSRITPGKNGEKILGKDCIVNVVEGKIVLMRGIKVIFKCNVEDTELGELMSLAGINIKGIDETDGEWKHIVAYYSSEF